MNTNSQFSATERRWRRREQKRLLVLDITTDMEKVQTLLEKATSPQTRTAYSVLYDILYTNYCNLMKSEV